MIESDADGVIVPVGTVVDAKGRDALVALVGRLEETLIWCSGSADFGPGGQAHKAWVRTVRPLLDVARSVREA